MLALASLGAGTSNLLQIDLNSCDNVVLFGTCTSKQTLLSDLKSNISKCIKIYCGGGYMLYCDDRNNYYCVTMDGNGLFNYFQYNHVNIQKICVNINSVYVFWISEEGDVYKLILCTSRPKIVTFSGDFVDDIQSSNHYSIALCGITYSNYKLLISNWSRLYIPNEIEEIIRHYADRNGKVYATGYSDFGGTGHGKYTGYDRRWQWEEVKFFTNKDIIKIKTGSNYSLFLEKNGNVWSCGHNQFGQCGLDWDGNAVYKPTQIGYFEENGIRIKDISCGISHNLALDYDGRVYSWGINGCGQCGQRIAVSNDIIRTPRRIRYLEKYNIIEIKCGSGHSYCLSSDGKHFLFGSNGYGECIGTMNELKVPFCINDRFKEITNGNTIKSVSLGSNCTQIIV